MNIGGRVSFEKIEELGQIFENVKFSIELALPWRYHALWLPMETKLNEVITFFKNTPIEILSIHATQGRISEETFLEWGAKTLNLADSLSVPYVTIHPIALNPKRPRFNIRQWNISVNYKTEQRLYYDRNFWK